MFQQYEVEPRTSVPLTSSLPGITVRTDRYDYQYLPLDANDSKATTSGDSVAIKLNGGSSRLDRGRRERVGFGRRVEIVRHLVVNREAYRFFHRGDNNFYCTAIDRRLGLRQTDYFSINKIWAIDAWWTGSQYSQWCGVVFKRTLAIWLSRERNFIGSRRRVEFLMRVTLESSIEFLISSRLSRDEWIA